MSVLFRLRHAGRLRQGRRTPETVYASFSEDLDDRTDNFPLFLCHDVPLAKFVVEAVNEKLDRGRRPTDPEAWLADQLAQVRTSEIGMGDQVLYWGPAEESFQAVQKLAQEYGEMCAARATEGISKP